MAETVPHSFGSLSGRKNNHPIPLGHHIRKLVLNNDFLAQDHMSLLRFTPLLEDLHLESNDLSSSDMNAISVLCFQLQILFIRGFMHVCEAFILPFGENCPHLRDLTFASMIYIENSVWNIPPEVLTHLHLFNHLTRLSLYNNTGTGIDGVFMRSLLPQNEYVPLEKLVELNITFVTDIPENGEPVTDSIMTAFIKSHTQLQELSLQWCTLGNATLIAITDYLPDLKHLCLLDIQGFTVADIQKLTNKCPNCRLLKFLSCFK